MPTKKKNPHAVALGRKGGIAAAGAGARAFFSAMTPEQRTEYARRAARARWGAKKKSPNTSSRRGP